jgi:hypothetical protein
MPIDRALADAIYRHQLGAFVYAAFEAVNPGRWITPNWHIDAVCHAVEQMLNRKRKRLVINLPPRSLKSSIVSVCLPAWLLGRNPSTRIICASYSQDLADKFSRDCRALLETPFYKRLYPRTRLNRKKMSEGEFETTGRGYRLATSVGGVLYPPLRPSPSSTRLATARFIAARSVSCFNRIATAPRPLKTSSGKSEAAFLQASTSNAQRHRTGIW